MSVYELIRSIFSGMSLRVKTTISRPYNICDIFDLLDKGGPVTFPVNEDRGEEKSALVVERKVNRRHTGPCA